ncbi:exosortase K [Aureivirga sp. CE67]|uniref:exosortase K n=1 Tax=Aureivirga sp. CE67 TaxID=1788983 RepID=UPI0018CB6DAF|nr:exosortase K [Aureivirga sp. CE67]
MLINKKFGFYFSVIFIFIILSYLFKFSNSENTLFLTKPVSLLLEFATNSTSTFTKEDGFYFQKFHIYIDKSCAGFHLWMNSFLIFSFLIISKINKNLWLFLSLFLSLIFSYSITIIINFFRIYSNLILKELNFQIMETYPNITHQAIGYTTTITFLILIYYFTNKILNKKIYEKLS